MTQKECFKLFDKHYDQIKHEYLNHKNPALLTQHDFSDGAKTYVEGNWYAVGISSGDRKVNNVKTYPILYSILRRFPYKTNVAIMTVGPDTKIGNHTDNEGGWRYQMCLEDGGGDQSGMYVLNLDTQKQELYTWKTGEAFVFQPDLQLHNGFNKNPGERTTLLIDFYKESLYTKDKFEKYYQHYSECFEGLENLVDVYESRKQK